jgi:hypothetical protein
VARERESARAREREIEKERERERELAGCVSLSDEGTMLLCDRCNDGSATPLSSHHIYTN